MEYETENEASSGLGIAGVGSDDFNINTESDGLYQKFNKKITGQLWQPCAKRGCNTEPVCIDCEYCDKHCQCEQMD